MRSNTKTVFNGFITGGLLFLVLFFGMNYSGQNIFATIGLETKTREDLKDISDNSLIREDATRSETQSKFLIGKVSHPQYIPLKNSFRYINNKTGEIEEYSINKKEVTSLNHKTQGVRLAQWNNNGTKILMFSPFGARFLDLDTGASKTYNSDIIRPSLNDDGSKIAFIESQNNGVYQINTSDPNLMYKDKILETRNISWLLQWQNDNSLILTNIKNTTSQQIFKLDIKSSELKALTDEELIENSKIVDDNNIFVRLTDDGGQTITDVINSETGDRLNMTALDGDTKCTKILNNKSICVIFTELKNSTNIEIHQREQNNKITKVKNIDWQQKIVPDDIFVSYDQKSLYIYDIKYNQIISLTID